MSVKIIIEGSKSSGERYIPSILLTLHPLVQSRIRTLRRPHLARQKSLMLTAQTNNNNNNNNLTPNIFSLLHPLVQSRTWTLQRTAPSQTEVTGLNCSDHSTTSLEMAAWRALVSLHLTRIQDPTLRYTMLLLSIVLIKSQPSLTVFLLSSLRLS